MSSLQPNWAFLFKHPAHFIAFGAGSGLPRRAPGTWGTLAALPIYFFAYGLGGTVAVAATGIALFLIGWWASSITGRALDVSDHGGIVIDEIAAFLIVLAFTRPSWYWIMVAFCLFRVFDIVKPWPISVADRRIKGGFGVMFDDLLAAVCAAFLVWLAQQYMPF
jgi:phosphatidylglycerophosphatase A